MKNSLRFYTQVVAYELFDDYRRLGLIFKHDRRILFLSGGRAQRVNRLIHLNNQNVLAQAYEQTQLIKNMVTLGFGLFFLLRFDRDLKEWMQEKGITYENGSLVNSSRKITKQEAERYENFMYSDQYFFDHYFKLASSKYTLSELVRKIRATFPLHQFGFDFLLFEELCLTYPDLFSATRQNSYLLPHEEDLVRQWFLSQGKAKKQLLNRHISKCAQQYDNHQKTVSLFIAKLNKHPQGLVLHYLRLYAKYPPGLTAVQIKIIMTRLHAYLKKTGPFTYARKVSYDLILGLQVDLVIGLEADLAYCWRKQDLLNYWLVLIDEELGSRQSDVYYTDEALRAASSHQIRSFLQSVWQRSCFLDVHIKLNIPTLNNFTTSRV